MWCVLAPATGQSSGGRPSNGPYNPQSLLSAVCCHAPQFKVKQQHDSHELLRYLVDGLQVSLLKFQSVPATCEIQDELNNRRCYCTCIYQYYSFVFGVREKDGS